MEREPSVEVAAVYRALRRIRRVEEEIARVYPTDKIKSPVHLSIGQEAVSVGLCRPLRASDIVFGTYRGHALYLAKGGDLRAMIAELYGKAAGCAGGKGGSMHLIDAGAGVMGGSAVVATSIPLSVGYAYSFLVKKSDAVVVSVFGDGAADEGAFHESMNFAALKSLPILLVCENNRYAIHSPQTDRQRASNLCERAASYGMPATRIESNEVFRLIAQAEEAVAAIRAGKGPRFFEVMTYRWREHVGPGEDYHTGYRERAELEPHLAKDPMKVLGERLAKDERARIDAGIEAEIADAFDFAEKSPFPDDAELSTDTFAEAE
jgi:TPP-dependent pyruvate/acetoin dehydrogenase alpha subunit